jgi:LytS/YehU family sensor histidine kinase
MNPHFIFNSLNSINQYIAQNDEIAANKYLTSYSRLMRNIMENSSKDFIKLEKEIELIKEYLDLEYLRFPDKFDYKILIDEHIDTNAVFIPNMILQPNLENAIWHGLRYKEEKGVLKLQFVQEKNRLKITIEDDGIGLKASGQIKTKHQKMHKSRGLNNINERIKLLREIYRIDIQMQIDEKHAPETGVRLAIRLPLIHNIKS